MSMSYSPKENVLRFFRNEMPSELPPAEGLYTLFDANAYEERPAYVQTGTDWWGVKWKREDSIGAVTPDHTQPPVLEDITQWKEVLKFPDLESWPWHKVEEIDKVSEIDRENQVFEMMFVNGPFERLHMLMGFENALVSLLTEPEAVTEFLDAFMEWKLRLMDKVKEHYNPDVLMFHDDWGTQKTMFFSPDLWREIFKPQIQKAVDHCKKLGMIFEMHSCGKIEEIVPDFVEMGISAWQGMEINDVPKLKAQTGGKLAFHTTPDYQNYQAAFYAGTLKEEDMRRDVREKLIKAAEGGNYMPFPVMRSDEWWYDAMWDEIAKVGKTLYQN
jgi:hypothetical protein